MSSTKFQELNLNNSFLFPAALEDPETCRLVLECITEFPLDDGVKRIFFNTEGKNKEEVPKILIDFLGYLNDSTDTYVKQDLDEKVKQIHERIKLLKQDRNVEKNYMHYLSVTEAIAEAEKIAEEAKRVTEEEKRKAEEAKRKAEDAQNILREILFDSIAKLGIISEAVRERIKKEEDINILKSMHKTAMKAEFMEQFEKQIVSL